MDNIFFIWTGSKNKLKGFLQYLNTFHLNLKFPHKKSKISVNFSDVDVWTNGDKFETDLYSKPTDCHQFPELNSAHPIYINQSFIVKITY